MSLTLNMVGGGGGGLKATDALLHVHAPAGSTVTITKGTVTKTDLGHENADEPDWYDFYFIIHQSQFDSINPWTVTATMTGEDPVSDTIIIDTADEYDMELSFKYYLFRNGNQYISRTGGWAKYTYTSSWVKSWGDFVIEDGYIRCTANGTRPTTVPIETVNKVDLTDFTQAVVEYENETGDPNIVFDIRPVHSGTGNAEASVAITASQQPTPVVLNIANLT